MLDPSSTESEIRRQAVLGAAAAAVGYLTWGLSVIYYRQLADVSPIEILAHRALWSLLLVSICILAFGRMPHLMTVLRDRRALALLTVTATIIGSNWLVFIWAVNSGRILETSLGYFINPLVSVLAGVVLLGERLSRAQIVAMALAAAGVFYFTLALGFVPWISLFLAFSFAGYGYLKKIMRVEALEGLFVEVLVIAPFGIAYLIWQSGHGGSGFIHDGLYTDALLVLTGPMTTIPLLLFTFGAQRIRLTTLGLMQYLVPTTSFAIAVWLYGEPLEQGKIVTFAMIWTGLAIFTVDTWRKERELRRVLPSRA
ncbi:MAG: EamA family transporter RarD [Parvibaculum sp.]|uniref:EamA family transporter RarD n=1 Tax=Parvibaculum sp. TaxID=2024848 RepID=UPI002845D406|nr:EamA family transporter RarD [Parvibaculum sp.]MDR3499583.1 EamA family transporter RarD [Parvibaculum sp.]